MDQDQDPKLEMALTTVQAAYLTKAINGVIDEKDDVEAVALALMTHFVVAMNRLPGKERNFMLRTLFSRLPEIRELNKAQTMQEAQQHEQH